MDENHFDNQGLVKLIDDFLKTCFIEDNDFLSKKLDSRAAYVVDVKSKLENIRATIFTLKNCRVFIAEIHPDNIKKNNLKTGVDISDYLKYHIEYYLLRITTIKDLAIQLIILVYELDIRNGLGQEKRLKNWAKSEQVDWVIKAINLSNLLLKKITPLRNSIAHQGTFNNNEIVVLKTIETIINSGYKKRDDYISEKYNSTLINTILPITRTMQHNESEIGTFYFQIMKKLEPTFKNKITPPNNG